MNNCNKRKQSLSFGLVNTRSLWDKTTSLSDCFKNLDFSFAVKTETWFHQCSQLDKLAVDLKGEAGLSMINRMRKKTGPTNPVEESVTYSTRTRSSCQSIK